MSKTEIEAVQNWVQSVPIGYRFAASDMANSVNATAKTVGKVLRFQENVKVSETSKEGRSIIWERIA